MLLFVANWKMYKTYNESVAFARMHRDELAALSRNHNKLIIAPSLVCLDAITQIFKDTNVKLAAQNCAAYKSGPYTGEVDAASLAQIGCAYALVGHSERRQLFYETNKSAASKVALLFDNNITPIICIGETQEQFEHGGTFAALEEQLTPILQALTNTHKEFYIAYEPIWAIGSGKVPTAQELADIFSWLANKLGRVHNGGYSPLLYGGSVNEKNSAMLLRIPHIGGLLIGGASCDFQSLKKIVS